MGALATDLAGIEAVLKVPAGNLRLVADVLEQGGVVIEGFLLGSGLVD